MYSLADPSKLVWSARFLLYTLADLGLLGGQPSSYCIPQPTLVHWVVSQAPIVYPSRPGLLGGQPGSYCITQLTLVLMVLVYIPTEYVILLVYIYIYTYI